ncbi:competence type IV pilus minor pilin ComGD [Sutcliffiella halmapala]|uniref:competence type IV pilus minor pilin ComGD n=1 Tax=Sutcliffiella halmapala TaxID=79882 RepID=UPI000995400F|nr:competence type IV pilus minor pilin ComGD [Sutcliffiella halmapala]
MKSRKANSLLYSSGGFTFLESILVLSIVSIILSVSVLKLAAVEEKHIAQNFFYQFSNDVLFAQQYAMSTKHTVSIIIVPSHHYYRITQGSFNEVLRRNYHEDISIDPRTMGTVISFQGNGSIQKAGTMGLTYKQKESFRIVFQLGKGRFYVEAV